MSTKIYRTLLCLPLLLPLLHAGAQNVTWLGLEGGPKWDRTRLDNADPYFNTYNVKGAAAGLSLWQGFGPNFSMGTGFYLAKLYEGFGMTDQRPGSGGQLLASSYQIPFRVEFKKPFPDFPVYLGFRFGAIAGIVNGPVSSLAGNSLLGSSSEEMLNYSYSSTPNDIQMIYYLESGLTGGLKMGNNWELVFSILQHTGLKKISRTTLSYTGTNGITGSADYTSKGTNLQLSAALLVPFSNIWLNRDIRIRSRIENSVYRGKETDQSNSIYFGGEIGSLWKSFLLSNPAITARPVNNRGIFRYANLVTGGYIGYMFTDHWGADLGGYYQKATLFAAASYDQDYSTAAIAPAPFILEFPLRIRYVENIYKQQVFLVFSAGGSLFLQFAGDNYATVSTPFSYTDISGNLQSGTMNITGNRPSMFGGSIRLAAGAEYRIPMKFPLILTTELSYSQGLTLLDQALVTTSIAEVPESSTVSYLGTGWRISTGIKIPIKLGQRGKRKCGALPRIR